MIEEDEETNVTSNTNTPDFATPEKQEARAFLRERFLRVVTGIVGKKFHECLRSFFQPFISFQTNLHQFPLLLIKHNQRKKECYMQLCLNI